MLKALALLISTTISSPFNTTDRVSIALWNHPRTIVIVGVELLAAYLLSLWVHGCLNKAFSTVWYAKQRELRDALKAARVEMGSGV